MPAENHENNAGHGVATSPDRRGEGQRGTVGDTPSASSRFHSILCPGAEDPPRADAPDYFHDLNLDQVVAAITADWQDSDLAPWFQAPLNRLDQIEYRQEVMRDLDDAGRMEIVNAFLAEMRKVRAHRSHADGHCYPREQQYWILEACVVYCECVERLWQGFHGIDFASRGLTGFSAYLGEYVGTSAFGALMSEAKRLKSDLSAIRYSLLIEGASISVRLYDGEADYSQAVDETFEKFRRGTAKDYRIDFLQRTGMNHIEAQILEYVARLLPDTFLRLETFCAEHADYLDESIARFDREIRFYVAYLAYAEKFRRAGLSFCHPTLSRRSREIACRDAYDPALADKLLSENALVVCNDFYLREPERLFVVTGPNQGGKTTFARMFGQLHYLASLGCPVPAHEASLFHFDRLFAHFERHEDIANLRGKLQDDLVRIHRILEQATPDSIVIMNEIFSSTSLKDAVYLSGKVMERISRRGLIAVCVTFLDELSTFDDKTVSLVSSVTQGDPMARTYKVERRRAEGLAYALAIAEKHGVTHDRLLERIAS